MHSRSTYPILRTTYQNNFLFSRVNFSLPDRLEWINVISEQPAGCIEQIHCCYMYIRVRFPSKKKTWGMPGTDIYFILSIKQILDRVKWGASLILIKQSMSVTGRVDSQAFHSSYLPSISLNSTFTITFCFEYPTILYTCLIMNLIRFFPHTVYVYSAVHILLLAYWLCHCESSKKNYCKTDKNSHLISYII